MLTGIVILVLFFVAFRFLCAVVRTIWFAMVSMMWFVVACLIVMFLLFGR